MFSAEDRLEKVLLFSIPVVIVVLGCGAEVVPPRILMNVLNFLTAWTFASVPAAVLIGHCVQGDR